VHEATTRRTALVVALTMALLLPALAAAAPRAHAAMIPQQTGVEVGIADQKADMFFDARFGELGIKRARLAVAWDVMTTPRQVAELDRWMDAAQALGVEPLLSFMHSRNKRRQVPSPLRLQREFRRLRDRYPWATTFATWNEANHCGEPLCHRPKLAAAFYRVLRRECPTCTILAPEVLDTPNMRSWVQAFSRELGFMPQLWGLHNYVEANRFKMRRLRELLRITRGASVWLTETGGLVRRDNGSTTVIPEGVRHAGDVTRYIFDRIVPLNPRVRRVYIYHWNSVSAKDTWDSGLVSPSGHERSALYVLSRVLHFGLRPLAIIRSAPAPAPAAR
jgi:hypothetical protein